MNIAAGDLGSTLRGSTDYASPSRNYNHLERSMLEDNLLNHGQHHSELETTAEDIESLDSDLSFHTNSNQRMPMLNEEVLCSQNNYQLKNHNLTQTDSSLN